MLESVSMSVLVMGYEKRHCIVVSDGNQSKENVKRCVVQLYDCTISDRI